MKFVYLTTNDINRFMALVLTRGIGHWCSVATAPMTYRGWLSDALATGHELWLTESETGEAHLLNLERLIEGMGLYADIHSLPLADHRLDLSKIDATIADHIVQYALFSKVRYE